MQAPILIPEPTQLRRNFSACLDRKCVVRPAPENKAAEMAVAAYIVYTDDSGTPLVICRCDLELLAFAGAALAMIPGEMVSEDVRSGCVEENVYENFQEVCNIIGAKVFNGPDSPHVALRSMFRTDREVPADVRLMVQKDENREAFEIEIEDYGKGILEVLTLAGE